MRKYKYDQSPWIDVFPELLKYNANPSSKSNPICAADKSCPVAAWNQTVVCNAAVGLDRAYASKVVWPTDSYSDLSDAAKGEKNVPFRKDALIEKGNIPGSFSPESSVESVDAIEKERMKAVVEFAKRVAAAGEATYPSCDEGTRRNAARLDIAGRFQNPCIERITNGIASCEPCDDGIVDCAPRDLPKNGQCSCNYDED